MTGAWNLSVDRVDNQQSVAWQPTRVPSTWGGPIEGLFILGQGPSAYYPGTDSAEALLDSAIVYAEEGQYTALVERLGVATCGATAEAARASLFEALREYKEFLEENEASLAPDLLEQLCWLRREMDCWS